MYGSLSNVVLFEVTSIKVGLNDTVNTALPILICSFRAPTIETDGSTRSSPFQDADKVTIDMESVVITCPYASSFRTVRDSISPG